MLLIVIPKPGSFHEDRKQIPVPGVARTEERGEFLIAYNGAGDKIGQIKDWESYYLEES